MLKQILVIVNIISFILFLYGIYSHLKAIEPNSCQMTYMFQVPHFKKIPVTNNKFFSNYGLYYYTEGSPIVDIQSLTGAPVLFVPGNGGSYKQARSLASVALRMGMQFKNNVHLDYFTIDYGEELSAFFGGYLEKQKQFLKISIRKIENIYRKHLDEPIKIVIVAHSMGGIVAQSILCEKNLIKHIGGIIFLSTPLDRPVVNIDTQMNNFYEILNNTLQETSIPQNPPNYNNKGNDIAVRKDMKNEVLLVSIGGGVRDLQVPAWLTKSPYCHIHVMTFAIPNVWLSCDHLSIVWCLQLMKVINKFLFSIVQRQPNNYVFFRQDFESNLLSAYEYFVGSSFRDIQYNEFDFNDNAQNNELWHLAESHQYQKTFRNGIQRTYNEFIPLQFNNTEENIYIKVSQADFKDWLYGCISEEVQTKTPACNKIFSMSNHITWIPTEKSKKSYALLDVQDTIKAHTDWTHILVRLPATKNTVSMQCDIFNPTERNVRVKAPSWINITKESVIFTSTKNAAYVQLIIEDVKIAYLAIELHIKKLHCSREKAELTIKTSASWAQGFEEYITFQTHEQEKHIIVNPNIESSSYINSSSNHVNVEIHMDQSCRLMISQKLSFQHSMRRIIQRFLVCLPAHLIAVSIIILAKQCFHQEISGTNSMFKNVFMETFQFDSMLIAIVCYLLQYYYQNSTMPNTLYELFITILLQGTALITRVIISLTVCALLSLCSRLFMITMPRLSNILNLSPSAYIPTMISPWLTAGIVILSVTLVTCCSIGLLMTCLVYFLWLSNTYKNMLLKRDDVSKEFEYKDMILSIRNQNNLLLHLKLFQLLLFLTTQNAGEVLAWLIRYPSSRQIIFFNSQSISNILLLISWTLLWEMEDLINFYNSKTASLILYSIAVTCILSCQENVFIINFIVASVYFSFLLFGLLYQLEKWWKH